MVTNNYAFIELAIKYSYTEADKAAQEKEEVEREEEEEEEMGDVI